MSNQGLGPDSALEQFEVIGPRPVFGSGRSRRYVGVLGAAAVAAATVGGGMWAWRSWTAQGTQPAHALPADTLAYAALDLDPPGDQKVAAYRTLRKFPSVKKDLGLGSTDDLRKSVVDQLDDGTGCHLDFADIKPWMGDRVAFAVVAQAKPEPVVVVQVRDATRARAGLEAAGKACHGQQFGYSVDGEWAVLARNDAVAAQVTKDAQRGSLDGDADFRALTKAAGDPGLATLYAAPEAGKALLEASDQDAMVGWSAQNMLEEPLDPMASMLSLLAVSGVAAQSVGDQTLDEQPSSSVRPPPKYRKAQARLAKRFRHIDELSKPERRRLIREQDKLMKQMYGDDFPAGADPGDAPGAGLESADTATAMQGPELDPAMRASLQHFTGLGGVARFAGGTLEVEITGDAIAGTSADAYAGKDGDRIVSKLPADTAITFGAGLSDTWVDTLMTRLNSEFPYGGDTRADTIASFEKSTGLDVPGDLEALGGEGFSVVAGSGFSPEKLLQDPAHQPVAVRITGDPARIEGALDKLRSRIGPDAAAKVLSRPVADGVVVGPDADYLAELAKGGARLGDSSRFKAVVPDAEDATTVLYVDFDAGDWLARSTGGSDRSDAEPMDTLGLTVTKHDGKQRLLLRLTFD